MTTISDRDARWLPSRFNLPLFRLYALVRCTLAKPERQPGKVYVIDRHQSALENFTVAAVMYVFAVAFTTELLSRWMHVAVAATVALLFVPFLLEIPLFLLGNLARHRNQLINSAALITGYVVVASYCATLPGWVRWAGSGFLVLLALNAAAAPIVWLLRQRIASLEAACAS